MARRSFAQLCIMHHVTVLDCEVFFIVTHALVIGLLLRALQQAYSEGLPGAKGGSTASSGCQLISICGYLYCIAIRMLLGAIQGILQGLWDGLDYLPGYVSLVVSTHLVGSNRKGILQVPLMI